MCCFSLLSKRLPVIDHFCSCDIILFHHSSQIECLKDIKVQFTKHSYTRFKNRL